MQQKIKMLSYEQIFNVLPSHLLISKDATLVIDDGSAEWAYRQGANETALAFFHRVLWDEVQKERHCIADCHDAVQNNDFEAWRLKNGYPHDATVENCLFPHLEAAIALF